MTSSSASDLVRSDIWFEDGNILLVAENVAFRVHRGQLERHSDVFHDLFLIPQPQDQHLVDGCSVVELHDSASDITFLLRALYDGLYFYKPYANDWQAIEAVLRLSTKYFIEHLRQRCLSRLNVDWPVTLDQWDAREREATNKEGEYVPRELSPHPILVIKLAKELDALAFALPAAFYDLSRYGPRKIVSGTVAPSPLNFGDSHSVSSCEDNMTRLSTRDTIRILSGREHGQRYMSSFVESTLINPSISAHCINKDINHSQICRQSFYFLMLNTLRAIGGIAFGRDADPLFTLSQTGNLLDSTAFSDGTDSKTPRGLNICLACKADFKLMIRNAREEVWRLIPHWFGLPDYEVLKRSTADL